MRHDYTTKNRADCDEISLHRLPDAPALLIQHQFANHVCVSLPVLTVRTDARCRDVHSRAAAVQCGLVTVGAAP